MKKVRNNYLDFLRGLAAINVIIIHTAFWSGGSYVPVWMQNLVLMLDVPFFFFISGWSFGYSKSNIKAFKGIIKIQKQYLFFLIIYSFILFVFSREDVSWNNLIYNFFYIKGIKSKLLPVVMGSMWFMPVYIAVVAIFPTLIIVIEKYKDKSLYLILLLSCFFGVIYSQIGGNFFNISIKILFYGFFYILGFISKDYKISSIKALIYIFLAVAVLILVCKKAFLIDKIVVQDFKFPPNIMYLLMSLISISVAVYFKNRITINKKNFICKIGEHALFYYFGQGISSSIIYFLVRNIDYIWEFKFLIVMCVNIILAIIISELLYKLYILTDNFLAYALKKIIKSDYIFNNEC